MEQDEYIEKYDEHAALFASPVALTLGAVDVAVAPDEIGPMASQGAVTSPPDVIEEKRAGSAV